MSEFIDWEKCPLGKNIQQMIKTYGKIVVIILTAMGILVAAQMKIAIETSSEVRDVRKTMTERLLSQEGMNSDLRTDIAQTAVEIRTIRNKLGEIETKMQSEDIAVEILKHMREGK